MVDFVLIVLGLLAIVSFIYAYFATRSEKNNVLLWSIHMLQHDKLPGNSQRDQGVKLIFTRPFLSGTIKISLLFFKHRPTNN